MVHPILFRFPTTILFCVATMLSAAGPYARASLSRTLYQLSPSIKQLHKRSLGSRCWNASTSPSLSKTTPCHNIILIPPQNDRARFFSSQPSNSSNGLQPLVSISDSEKQQSQDQTPQLSNSESESTKNHDNSGSSGSDQHDAVPLDIGGTSTGWEHDMVAQLYTHHGDLLMPTIWATSSATASPLHEPVMDYQWYNYWTKFIMNAVHYVHDETGLSYASCIMLFTALTRVALMPLAVWSRRHEALRDMLQVQIDALYEMRATSTQMQLRLKAEAERLRDKSMYRWQYRLIYPVTSSLAIIFMFIGLRQMCNFYPDEFETGGYWFFQDLTDNDEFFYLPILSCTAFLAAGELGADVLGRPSRPTSELTKWGWRGFRVGFFAFILYDAPAAVHCYWIPNSILSVVQATIFASPAVLKALNIPLPTVKAGPEIYIDEKAYDADPLKRDLQRYLVPVKLRSAQGAGRGRKKKSQESGK